MQLALFDFDETLIRENSLSILFKDVTKKRFLLPEVWSLCLRPETYRQGIKYSIKRRLYKRCLLSKSEADLIRAGKNAAERLSPLSAVVDDLRALNSKGYTIWVVTATPPPFVKSILDTWDLPVSRVIGTELYVEKGAYTGEFGEECMLNEKVRRIEQIIDDENLDANIGFAYGNLPVDIPMMSLAERSYAVDRGRVTVYNITGEENGC